MRKRSKNRSGLEKEDGWWWKYRPVIVLLQSVITLNKKADTNQLHCWRGGQWNIILKRYFRYHITIVYSKGYERRNQLGVQVCSQSFFLLLTFRLHKRIKNRSGLEKEDSWCAGVVSLRLEEKRKIISRKRHALCDPVLRFARNR